MDGIPIHEKSVRRNAQGNRRRGKRMTKRLIVASERRAALVVWTLLISLNSVGPAYAVLRPYGYMGRVVGKEAESATIKIQTEYRWGSSGWQTDRNVLDGTAPNEDAMNEIRVGDYVLATSLGVPGGSWITLATMKSSTARVVTDIYGDPGYVWDIPLSGAYAIEYTNMPDCSRCDGCNCNAEYTEVTITSRDDHAHTHQLNPGESCIDQASHQSIDITFLSGQAPSSPECGDTLCVGPQAVSDFTIHIGGDTENLTTDSNNGGGNSDCFISTVAAS